MIFWIFTNKSMKIAWICSTLIEYLCKLRSLLNLNQIATCTNVSRMSLAHKEEKSTRELWTKDCVWKMHSFLKLWVKLDCNIKRWNFVLTIRAVKFKTFSLSRSKSDLISLLNSMISFCNLDIMNIAKICGSRGLQTPLFSHSRKSLEKKLNS